MILLYLLAALLGFWIFYRLFLYPAKQYKYIKRLWHRGFPALYQDFDPEQLDELKQPLELQVQQQNLMDCYFRRKKTAALVTQLEQTAKRHINLCPNMTKAQQLVHTGLNRLQKGKLSNKGFDEQDIARFIQDTRNELEQLQQQPNSAERRKALVQLVRRADMAVYTPEKYLMYKTQWLQMHVEAVLQDENRWETYAQFYTQESVDQLRAGIRQQFDRLNSATAPVQLQAKLNALYGNNLSERALVDQLQKRPKPLVRVTQKSARHQDLYIGDWIIAFCESSSDSDNDDGDGGDDGGCGGCGD